MFMNDITSSLSILSSMITPAVLILACGSLIMTTSQRLSRVIERVRKIAQEFMQIKKSDEPDLAIENKRRILYRLLQKSAKRSKLLVRAMTLLYISLGLFVATSLAIGVVAITHARFTWIPTAIGVTGAIMLFVSSAVLVVESRMTLSVIGDEMDFVLESSRSNAPDEKREKKKLWHRLFSRWL